MELIEALERVVELSEEKEMVAHFTYKNISMSMKLDPMCTTHNQDTYKLKDLYCSVNQVEFNLEDIKDYKYYSLEDAKHNMNSGITCEHLAINFEDGSKLIILEEV